MAAPPKHWLPAFLRFCELVTITSKEDGRVNLKPYDAQLRFLKELDGGLSEDVHDFKVCKARQLGLSTVMLALDVFWLYMFEGLQGALIFDSAKNLQVARRLITEMLESLPADFKVPVASHNRDELVLGNGSSLQYMSAGKNSKLGISRALNFMHASEIGAWQDQDGIDNLKATLAAEYPNRLYVWESTAFGFNVFHTLYQDAKDSATERAIFLGWWAKEIYRIALGTPEFDRWWGAEPHLSEEEARTQQIVQDEYDHTITPEQWAWYRREADSKGEQSLKQMYPSHEEEAWQETGTSFFPLKRIGADLAFLVSAGTRAGYQGFRYEFGTRFTSLKIEQVGDASQVELRVWEQPRAGGRYVIGVDVAFGRDETADRSCVSVWRCYADKLVQVAEFTTPWPETHQTAWALAHLAGCYRGSMINLEISGPGGQVFNELNTLKDQIQFGHLRETAQAIDPRWALDNARWFLYSRVDSLGPNYAFAWKTTLENKLMMMNSLRDSYSTEEVLVRSIPLLDEMKTYVQDGLSLHASGRNKDDRVMGAGLAHHAWRTWVWKDMAVAGETYDRVANREALELQKGVNVIDWIVPAMMREFEEQRTDAEFNARRMLEI